MSESDDLGDTIPQRALTMYTDPGFWSGIIVVFAGLGAAHVVAPPTGQPVNVAWIVALISFKLADTAIDRFTRVGL